MNGLPHPLFKRPLLLLPMPTKWTWAGVLLAATLLSACASRPAPTGAGTAPAPTSSTPANPVATPPTPAPHLRPDFILGADISWVPSQEDHGIKFRDQGVEKDVLEILKSHGFNYVRLRLFVDPTAPGGYSPEGYCGLARTVAMAQRVKAAGLGLLIDFHYSDNWADPGKQTKPTAWRDLPFPALVKAVHDYTRDAIAQFQAAGATPDMVQVGNEITPGFLLNVLPAARGQTPRVVSTQPDGSTRNWNRLATLLIAGIQGVKDVDPNIKIMLHIDRGGDILGESCYPRYQGPPEKWSANLADLVVRYPHLHFIIAEYSQDKREANDIVFNLPDDQGLGTFIWEPTRYGEPIFDRDGNTLPNIAVYDQMRHDYGLR
jgi:arabinogalactan endo-1,4-beta-galactosidase